MSLITPYPHSNLPRDWPPFNDWPTQFPPPRAIPKDDLKQFQTVPVPTKLSGTKTVIVCGGKIEELDESTSGEGVEDRAKQLSAERNAPAYILTPTKCVKPKREFEVVDLRG